jgi:hypothetical protein
MIDYAKANFRVPHRKAVPLDRLCVFQAEPITEPLLQAVDPKSEKLAVRCFKWILQYTGVDPVKNPGALAEKLLQSLTTPVLRDEVMFQLMKQTRENSSTPIRQKTWELFLIVVTLYPSTKKAEPYIANHFLKSLGTTNKTIASLANFCLIRFSARCAVGKPMEVPNYSICHTIPEEHQICHIQFGASIYEQLWNQHRFLRRFPIPMFLHRTSEILIGKGAEKVQGIFRLSGDMKRVQQIALEVNSGKDTITSGDVHVVASLFKKWFRDLPDAVVNAAAMEQLGVAFSTKRYIEFVEILPRAHRYVLTYLIGFLQQLVKAEPVTKMGAKNMAICFAPNIVRPESTEEAAVKRWMEIGTEFMVTLINAWDTSTLYPIRAEMFPHS